VRANHRLDALRWRSAAAATPPRAGRRRSKGRSLHTVSLVPKNHPAEDEDSVAEKRVDGPAR